MKILILTGSPHKNGTSNTLTKEFQRGALESGHKVEIYDCADGNIHPCLGCDFCKTSGICCQNDDGNAVLKKLLSSDMVVFSTPVYYFGMSAQLKMIIDRFYARNKDITNKHLKTALIATAWSGRPDVMNGIQMHFDIIFNYLSFEIIGTILAKNSGTVEMLSENYLEEAYELGKKL